MRLVEFEVGKRYLCIRRINYDGKTVFIEKKTYLCCGFEGTSITLRSEEGDLRLALGSLWHKCFTAIADIAEYDVGWGRKPKTKPKNPPPKPRPTSEYKRGDGLLAMKKHLRYLIDKGASYEEMLEFTVTHGGNRFQKGFEQGYDAARFCRKPRKRNPKRT